MRLRFYEPIDSPHKADLLDALAADPEVGDVLMIADAALTPDRAAQGWHAGHEGRYRKLVAPSDRAFAEAIASSGPEAVHIFSGLRHTSCVVQGLRQCLAEGRRFGFLAEPRVREGPAGAARLLQSWLLEGRLRRHAGFVLAIGRHGPDWFRRTGYPPECIVPFAYFLPGNAPPAARVGTRSRVAFVGRLHDRKGIADLLAAIDGIDQAALVEVVGAGPERPACEAAARRSDRLRVLGAMPMAAVRDYLGTVDVLVLPSRTTDEGWGAVVSEALLAGAVAVCTDVVGASLCLDDPSRGRIVPVRAPARLADAVNALLRGPHLDDAARAARSAWAHRHLTGAVGARILLAVMRHVYEGGPRPPSFLDEPPGLAVAPPRR